jgi:4-hydroxybenzoate polyprenyltransferase
MPGTNMRGLAAARHATDPAAAPLCVDLDGTLLHTDLLWEGLAQLLSRRPWLVPMIVIWLFRGMARLKSEIARHVAIDPALLPYDRRILSFLTLQRSLGRTLVLATASDRRLADAVATHLGLFDEVIASTCDLDLRGTAKAAALQSRFDRFAYLGNHRSDLPVWRQAETALAANASPHLLARLAGQCEVETIFPREGSRMRALVQALRPYQWCKNLLAFVPIVTADQLQDQAAWLRALWVAAVFCATASAIYVLNDLTDLAADRAHPRKRARPFASGALPLAIGVPLVVLLLSAALAVSARIHILPLTLLYCGVAAAYTFGLKDQPLIDVFALAFLYLIRLYAGGVATGYAVSMWLLGFSAFLFLALALAKRTAELADAETAGRKVERRAYTVADLPVLCTMGIGSSFVSSMLLVLYVQSPEVASRYSSPLTLWALVPLLLFWQTRLWLLATRGRMHDDPIVSAARDWVTWAVLVLVLVTIVAATRL